MSEQSNPPTNVGSHAGLGPLPAGLLTVASSPGIAYAGGMRRYEPIQALPDGEHKLYTQDALAAAVAAERDRCARLVETMDTKGHDGYIETTGDLCEALAACIRRA